MKKLTYLSVIILLCFSACGKKENPFLISKGKIGQLNNSHSVAKLDSLFANDSLVKRIGEGDYVQAGTDTYLVYEKGGAHLFDLTPTQQHDTSETIETVRIYDLRFKTDKGVGLGSSFKDIRDNYTISSIQNTLNSVVIFVNEIDAFITIDKKELPAELRYNNSLTIDAVQIPDDAKFKYFMLGW
jgi:hypothetical protein